MSGFNLDNYEPVDARLAKFWAKYETGRVVTDLIAYSDTSYIVRAEVFRDAGDEQPAASGYAQETVSARGVNSTSALENCETSAIGRALANLNFAPVGARPSREEMTKPAPVVTDPAWFDDIAKRIKEAMSPITLEGLKAEAQRRFAAGECTADDAALLRSLYDQASDLLAVPVPAGQPEPML